MAHSAAVSIIIMMVNYTFRLIERNFSFKFKKKLQVERIQFMFLSFLMS